MNVALELIKRTFDVPKDVMHYIIHMFRPRAPSGELEWDGWVEINPDYFLWYNWELGICGDGGYNLYILPENARWSIHVCGLCSKDICDRQGYHRLCAKCNDAINTVSLYS